MVDTNVLIYAVDADSGDKHRRAVALIQSLTDQGALTLSVQALNEFYAAATRPHKPPALSHEDAIRAIQGLIGASRILPLTAAVTLRALDAMPRHGFSFWDALIWAAARENDVNVLYTEDFQHGRAIEGVQIFNPFAPRTGAATAN